MKPVKPSAREPATPSADRLRLQPNCVAISLLDFPSAAASTIRQRNVSACALDGRRAHRSSTSRSSALTTTSARCPMTSPIVVVDDDGIRRRTQVPAHGSQLTTQDVA